MQANAKASQPDNYEVSQFPSTPSHYVDEHKEHLSLSRLGLTSVVFPPALSIATLDSLLSLDLSYNQLMSLNTPALSSLPSLLHLDVSNNLLQRLAPSGNNNLPKTLETLDASNNNLVRISGLDSCMDLRTVNLSHNKMRAVKGLEFLGKLQELDVSSNDIATQGAIRTLSCNLALRSLKMKNNPLSETRGYRPIVTCLLPHVKNIDGKGLPRTGMLASTEAKAKTGQQMSGEKSGVGGWVSKSQREEIEVRTEEERSDELPELVLERKPCGLLLLYKERLVRNNRGNSHP